MSTPTHGAFAGIVAVAFCLQGVGFAIAQECGQQKSGLSKSFELIERLTTRVENIPPDQQRYLEKEEAEAVDQDNRVKLKTVLSSQFYWAWKVRTSFEKVTTLRSNIDAAKDSLSRLKLGLALKDELEEFFDNLSSYAEMDRTRNLKVFDDGIFNRLGVARVFARRDVNRYLPCWVKTRD